MSKKAHVETPGPVRKLALVVEFEGTRYAGFQVQPREATVQGELGKALLRLIGEHVKTYGASRTDTGTHARGQVVAFLTARPYPPGVFQRALNAHLPPDIRVRAAYEVPVDFDPRRQALSRTYCYRVWNAPSAPALGRYYLYHLAAPLEMAPMRRAARLLVGTHDFAAFCGAGQPRGRSTIRRVYRARVAQRGSMVCFLVEANAFLPHQVRYMAGALVEVGLRRLKAAELKGLLGGVEAPAGRLPKVPCLPACGLELVRVTYKGFPPELPGGGGGRSDAAPFLGWSEGESCS
ncbi:MAG: tRNA pseudouridine(38-40) synthase TruA [Chloroflexi bacterium]|nr:tRNA pseudouridine(38-40) synthase TruA [Chloroflexota bacterium]